MDRTLLLRRLVEAERHITELEHVVTLQRHVIDTMARLGRDTAEACALLREFENIRREFS